MNQESEDVARGTQESSQTPADPRTKHPRIEPPAELQEEPGWDTGLTPEADHGEKRYRGHGRLAGRKALVTGADSGIGAAVALAFAREGAEVALAYLPEEDQDVEALRRDAPDVAEQFHTFPGDLLDKEYRGQLISSVVAELGGLDILVNNAGRQIACEDIAELSDEQVEQTFATNVFAMYTLSRDAVAHLPAGGSIINTTSIQAYSPSGHLLDYAATKAAINAFTKGLAEQLGPKGIRVNAVAPGPIWTPLQPSHGQPPEALPKFGHNTWLGRAGQPEELSPAYVYLASEEASFVTGSTLHVNGGQPSP